MTNNLLRLLFRLSPIFPKLLLLCLCGCIQDKAPSFHINNTDFHVGDEGGELYLDFTTESTWTINPPMSEWVSIGRLSGEGDAHVAMIILPNRTQLSRQCSFSIAYGNRSKDIIVLQEGTNTGGFSEKTILPPNSLSGKPTSQNGKYYASLSWGKVDNAIGYYLYYSQYTSSGFQRIGGSISELSTITEAHNGNNYYYVSSFSSIEESAPSEIVRVYIESSASAGDWENQGGGNGGGGNGNDPTKPSIPSGLSVTNQGSNTTPIVHLSWTSVSGATGYRIYRSSSPSSGYSQIGETSSTTFNDSSPVSGINYYKVTAYNSAGESGYSSYVQFTYESSGGEQGQKPSIPTGLTASNQGNNYLPDIYLSWNTVNNATGYKVYRSTSASSGYTKLGDTTYNSYSDSSPLSGYNYYKVTAYNSYGESGFSSYAVFNYDTASSLPPASPTVTANGTSSAITVSWTCATGNGYGTPKKYKVYKQDPYTSQWNELTSTTSRSYSDRNVHPGKNWYLVEAINDAGSSLGYGSSNEISLNSPTSFSASVSGSYIKCSWSKVTAATGYQIFQSSKASGDYYMLEEIDDVNTTSREIYYPASSGTIVYLKIRAFWMVGNSSPVYSSYSTYKYVKF